MVLLIFHVSTYISTMTCTIVSVAAVAHLVSAFDIYTLNIPFFSIYTDLSARGVSSNPTSQRRAN